MSTLVVLRRKMRTIENVKSNSTSTTLIVEKIDIIKRLIIDGKVTLVDDEGKPLAKVDSSERHDSVDVLSRKQYSHKCDVYAFGICLWEIQYCDMAYTYDLENIPSDIYKELRPSIPLGCPRSKRRDVRKRLRPKDARNMSRSPEPRRDRSKSPRRKYPERETVFRRLEKGVFHRLGDKEKGRKDVRKRGQCRRTLEDEDLSQPWVCEETDPFTPRIRYFDLPKRIRMPSHVKTYDGSEDPEDHLKNFQAAAKVEQWAMPTWCHMFNSTLTGNARVWFDDLLPESIDSYDDLKEAFLANYLQQKKCIKDPVEIHHIKQREGESTEDFVRRFKTESRDVKGAPEVMRISGFMHGITNPELIKRLHDKIPKSVDEMWKITTAFLRGEVAAGNQERKKTFPPWKQQDVGHRQNFKK
ncbi:reverse transcriptase domain-containing protein [Tanacetum coccineum]